VQGWALTGSQGFDRIAGVNFYFKKIKRRCFSKKKKKKVNGLQPGFCPGQPAGSHRVMIFSVFSSTWSGSSPGPAGSRVDPPGLAGFQNYAGE
jgi:hypothetical protein